MVAVRDNEAGAAALGVRPATVRLGAFALSGAIASVAGYLFGGLLKDFSVQPDVALALLGRCWYRRRRRRDVGWRRHSHHRVVPPARAGAHAVVWHRPQHPAAGADERGWAAVRGPPVPGWAGGGRRRLARPRRHPA